MKGLYTLSPYGWMTMPFADFEGRTIEIPAREIGVVIQRTYYKTLSKEKIAVAAVGDRYSASGTSVKAVVDKELVEGTGIYKERFETMEWDDQVWFTPRAQEVYEMILSEGIIRDSENRIVTGPSANGFKPPTDKKPEVGEKIITDSGGVLGVKHIITTTDNIYVFDDKNQMTAAFFRDREIKKDKPQFFVPFYVMYKASDDRDYTMNTLTPDGQKVKIVIPRSRTYQHAEIVTEATGEKVKINMNTWINDLMGTAHIPYVDSNLTVYPILSRMGQLSISPGDAEKMNQLLQLNDKQVTLFSTDLGLEASAMPF